jgi:hypothetical protein
MLFNRCLRTIIVLTFSIYTVASDPNEGIRNTFPNQRIPTKSYASVRQIDFKNSPIVELSSRHGGKVEWPELQDGSLSRKVVLGRFHNESIYGSEEVYLDAVQYFRCGGGECALLRYRYCSTGATVACEGAAEAIGLDSKGYPNIRQRIEYDLPHGTDSGEVWAHFYPEHSRLVVSGKHGWYKRLVLTFDWKGDKFSQVGRKILPVRNRP